MVTKKIIFIASLSACAISAAIVLYSYYFSNPCVIQEIAVTVINQPSCTHSEPIKKHSVRQEKKEESKGVQRYTNTQDIPKKTTHEKIKYVTPACKQKDPLYWDWQTIDTSQLYFPPQFLWGAATSAHQVEGYCTNNEWQLWEENDGVIPTGKACDHWHRYKEDIQSLKHAGLTSYRFSVEWSKIEPAPGQFDESALKHYEDLCKELVKQGIKPIVTLHHYTNPLWFYKRGSFEKEENIHYFISYCVKVFSRLHPYVHLWLTFNSPTSYAARAYYAQLAPPGIQNMQKMQEVLKNVLEAHVQTYHALKQLPGGPKSHIGICHNIYQVEPKHFWDSISCNTAKALFDDSVYKFFTTGHFKVSVPLKASVTHYNAAAPRSLDFIGLNYYSHGLMSGFNVEAYTGDIRTQNRIYTIYPEGLYRALMEVDNELAKPLQIPIYITENGIATNNEQHRKLFFERYLYALSYAIAQGCPVKGYCVWSLMDNYDWGDYNTPYGIYAVNFNTVERSKTPRTGAHYFIDVVKKFSN